ncbi:MAG: hypothetical protein SFZ23_15590 [Planctomycetota bacterium]|nr:hypothetical protein [Planctomycetota bacterium]
MLTHRDNPDSRHSSQPAPAKPLSPPTSRPPTPAGVVRRLLMRLGLLTLAAAAPACSSPPAPSLPDLDGPSFTDVPLRHLPSQNNHVVEVELPSPGYQATLDHTSVEARGRALFVTIRLPRPEFAYAQVITPVQLATGVKASEPAFVLARLVPHDHDRDDWDGFLPATTPALPPPSESPAPNTRGSNTGG